MEIVGVAGPLGFCCLSPLGKMLCLSSEEEEEEEAPFAYWTAR
jgi:hypothetical protein